MTLKLEDIVEIHRLHREGLSLRQIAKMFNDIVKRLGRQLKFPV